MLGARPLTALRTPSTSKMNREISSDSHGNIFGKASHSRRASIDSTTYRMTETLDEEMFSWFANQLKNDGLYEFFPCKLERKHLIKIFASDVDQYHEEPKGIRLLKGLISLNTKSRSVYDTEMDDDFHDPADEDSDDSGSACESECPEHFDYHTAIMAIFTCADAFVRRYLVQRMLMCQFAVPFILPITDKVLLWPMRVVKSWSNDSCRVIESCLASEPMPMLSVMQMGCFDRSVSADVLNELFNETGYCGFYNKSTCDGMNEISQGLVEIAWYLPRARKQNLFSNAFVAANLHGDASKSPKQRDYLLHVSSCVIIITKSLEELSKVLLPRDNVIVALHTSGRSARQQKVTPPVEVIAWRNTADIKKHLDRVKGKLENSAMTLEERVQMVEDFELKIDELLPKCVNGKMKALKVVQLLKEQRSSNPSVSPLLFQERWKKWVRLDKDQTRRKNKVDVELEESFIADHEDNKEAIELQLCHERLTPCFESFINFLKSSGEEEALYFLEWLQYLLNNDSRQVIAQKRRGSQELSEVDMAAQEDSPIAFGLEHFLRELGVFWSVKTKWKKGDLRHLSWLPIIVARLVYEGYPLEILDGDASYVPIQWIKEVFHCINKLIEPHSRVFVTSILGVQSSGKSTFLNTMFGVNFAVSSGRCTRGAYMQLVRVDATVQQQLSCEYLLVIDTEGLKSSEVSTYSNEHDNELATLAVGLSDISVMNIGGENDDGMKDVLGITCYAFLRMAVARERKPKCMMVHQNVGDLSANRACAEGKTKLFLLLDKMTELAAKKESCEKRYKKFTDIIRYDQTKMDINIPGLWNGSPPMASVNIDYSEQAAHVKKLILQEIHRRNSMDLIGFGKRVEDIYEAVKAENFIFSFQNAAAANAYRELAQEYERAKWDIKTEVLDWIAKKEARLKRNRDYSEERRKQSLKEAADIVMKHVNSLEDMLRNYFDQHQEVVAILQRNKSSFENDIAMTKKQTTLEIHNKIEDIFHKIEVEDKVEDVFDEGKNKLMEKLQELKKRHSVHDRRLTVQQKKNLKDDFEVEWQRFLDTNELSEQHQQKEVADIVMRCFRTSIKEDDHLLNRKQQTIRHYHVTEKDINLTQRSSIGQFCDDQNEPEDPMESSKDILERANCQAQGILKNCYRKISCMAESDREFREDDCYNVIRCTNDLISSIVDPDFTFSMYFRVNMLHIVCMHASEKFTEMQESFKARHDPRSELDLRKKKYLQLAMSLVEADSYAKTFCGEIESGILYQLLKQVPTFIRRSVKDKRELQDRKQMQVAMLLNLHKENNFDGYVKFLSNFRMFCYVWLNNQAVSHLREKMHGGQTRFFHILKRKMEDAIGQICMILRNYSEVNAGYRTLIESLYQLSLDDEIYLHLDRDIISRLKVLPIEDLREFIRDVCGYLEKDTMASLAKKIAEIDVHKELGKMNPSIEEQLFESLTCPKGEQCPFCSAPCSEIGPHEEHKVDMHHPQGLSGWKHKQTRHLIEEECPLRLARNKNFKCSKTRNKSVSFRKYQKFFPHWYIPKDKNPHKAKYWKMVLMQFNKQLASWYSAYPAKIPDKWKGYQWPVVKRDLENIYGIRIPD